MNLIEQLGGYARAIKMSKEWESSIDGDIPLDTMMYSYDFGIFSWGDLQSALLEYRRQHSIFEVGDAMVIPSRGNGIFHFNALFSDSDIAEARHATDAEIKAGKRLEVNQ